MRSCHLRVYLDEAGLGEHTVRTVLPEPLVPGDGDDGDDGDGDDDDDDDDDDVGDDGDDEDVGDDDDDDDGDDDIISGTPSACPRW